ncbi:MAG: histidine kinase dimerization/phospho-acceptor domain-containing protein [Persicimonas sp.]
MGATPAGNQDQGNRGDAEELRETIEEDYCDTIEMERREHEIDHRAQVTVEDDAFEIDDDELPTAPLCNVDGYISEAYADSTRASTDLPVPSGWQLDPHAFADLQARQTRADDDPLSDLAGAVGHELNNPLTSCVGYLHQLSSMVPSSDSELNLIIDRLGKNLNRIHSIVGELELLAAIAHEARQQVDLSEVVERIYEQLGSYLETEVELFLQPAYLDADRPRLKQLVYILLATHMIDEDTTRWCSAHVNSNESMVRFDVTSTNKPYGALRLDLLGILRRKELPAAAPLQLAAELTRELGGIWNEGRIDQGYRTTAILPRYRLTATSSPDRSSVSHEL